MNCWGWVSLQRWQRAPWTYPVLSLPSGSHSGLERPGAVDMMGGTWQTRGVCWKLGTFTHGHSFSLYKLWKWILPETTWLEHQMVHLSVLLSVFSFFSFLQVLMCSWLAWNSLCSWRWIWDPPAPTSWVLALQACTIHSVYADEPRALCVLAKYSVFSIGPQSRLGLEPQSCMRKHIMICCLLSVATILEAGRFWWLYLIIHLNLQNKIYKHFSFPV